MLDDAFARLQQAASHAATSHHNDRSDPTPAQCEAGNYKHGHIVLHGLPLSLENDRNSMRAGTSADGKPWSNRMNAIYGEFSGTKGNDGDPVDVFIGQFPESRSVWVINQGWPDGGFDEHKVCLAFSTEQQARDAYLMSFDRDWTGLRSMVRCTVSQLKWWLKNGDMSRPLTLDQLPHDGTTTMKTLWNADAQPLTTPLHKLMYDLRVDDSAGLMLDAVSMADIMGDPDIQALPIFDALVVEVNRMTVKMNVLQRTMDAAGGDVKVTGYQISDPIKARGVMQVAVLFALSDGQTVTVWFHNPDTTPAKLMPMDELISWKWMLNKKDITIVVAPEKGHDLNVREVSRRIMRLAERNTDAFAKANGKLAERIAAEAAIDGEIVTLTGTLAAVQHKIEVAKVSKADTYSRTVRELMDKLTAVGKQIEVTAPGAKAGNTASLASLEALMNESDDIADKITALRGDEAAGRTSWAQWNKLRAGDNAEAWRGDAPAFDGKTGTVAEWGTGDAMPEFSGVAYDYMARAFVLTTLENGERTFNYLTASTYAAALIEAAELAAKLSVDKLVPAVAAGSPLDAFEAVDGESWQVTRAKWVEIMQGHFASLGQTGDVVDFEEAHRGAVKTALDAGKPVPAEVLADYPGMFGETEEQKAARYAAAEANLNKLMGAAAGETPAARVDAAYLFTNATDAFKAEVAESLDDEEYSPFVSAKNMDLAAKAAGASIAWSVGAAMLDGTEDDETEVPGEDPDEEDFDEGAEWDATPEEEVEEQLLDGDFVGHPFRGNAHRSASHESGAAVGASMRAKHAERKGDAKASSKAHTSAHYSHKAASVSAKGAAKKYHAKMAKFHGSRGGVSKLDSVVAVLDAAQKMTGMIIGKIKKGSTIVGRALIMSGDGKAMVYVGKVGTERVMYTSQVDGERRKAMWSDDDAGAMIGWLLAPAVESAPAVSPQPEQTEEDVTGYTDAFKRAGIDALIALGWKDQENGFASKEIKGGYRGQINPEGVRRIIARFVPGELVATFGDDIVARSNYTRSIEASEAAKALDLQVVAMDVESPPNERELAIAAAASEWSDKEILDGGDVARAKVVKVSGYAPMRKAGEPYSVAAAEANEGMLKITNVAGPAGAKQGFNATDKTFATVEAAKAWGRANGYSFKGDEAAAVPVAEPVAAPAENDRTRLRAAEKAAPSDSIFSDDPKIIEKLQLKLTALQMRQEFMKKANKFFKKPALGDAGLLEMGMSQLQIDGLRKPDFGGRIGFADYLLTNNNGVIGTTRKRLEAMQRDQAQQQADEPTPSAAHGDISYRAVDDMFTQFYPDSTAGEVAFASIAEHSDGTGKVSNQHVESTIAQLVAAGYTVTEASAPEPMTGTEEDDLLKALNEQIPEGIPVNETPASAPSNAVTFYMKGDLAEYTGKVEQISGGTFYEYKFLEGANVGKTGVTQRAPDGTNPGQAKPEPSSGIITPQVPVSTPAAIDPALAADRAYLESLIDGSGDLLAEDTFTKLEPMFAKYEADAEMNALLERAATVYGDAAVAAAQTALATPA